LSLKPQNLEPNGRPISRSHSFKSNRNTATQLCLKLCWHAVFHTQEHAASSNGPTIIDRVHSEPDSPAIHYTLRSWSGKTKLRAPPSYGRAFKTSQPVLHECVNQQFLQSDQQISRTTIIAHSTCLWARIHRPGCSVNNPGNSNETPLTRSLFSSFVFSVGHSSRPNSSLQLLINEALVVEVEQVEVDQVVVKGSMVS
jgi:hypothetical protein